MTILAITDVSDPQFLVVQHYLHSQGAEILAFDTRAFPLSAEISYHIGDQAEELLLKTEQYTLDLQNVGCVWVRKNMGSHLGNDISNYAQTLYTLQECKDFLVTLPNLCPTASWFPNHQMLAHVIHKPLQLKVAKALGFKIPHSVIGNAPDVARKLLEAHGRIALKPVLFNSLVDKTFLNHWVHLTNLVGENQDPSLSPLIASLNAEIKKQWEESDFLIFTKCLQDPEASEFLPHIHNAPLIAQQYIEKKLELRVTIVGDSVFACAIDSQALSEAAEDFRQEVNYAQKLPHRVYDLPPKVERLCLEMCREFQMDFAAIDMILTPDEEYVFLEINPNPMWLWVEQRTGLPIAKAIGDRLIATSSRK